MNKLLDLAAAVAMVNDGDTVAFGGNVLYRSPIAAVKELIRQDKKDLHLVKTAIAYEVDLLCAAGAASRVTAGFVGYEGEFGLCRWYRKGVESATVRADENACYSVITALRGAAYGVPFLPIRGMLGSDLLDAVGFPKVTCPYTGEELVAIRAIAPDVAFLHVQKADEMGNGCIIGPTYEDTVIARAAKKLVLTAEEIVPSSYFSEDPNRASIPAVLTTAVVKAPGGAKPCAVSGCYDMDREELRAFLAEKDPDAALRAAGIERRKDA